jgi:hypothetical protein
MGNRKRKRAMIEMAADGDAKDDLVDHAAEEEALERYYRRRIQEIRRDERRPGGSSWTLDEVKRMAGEQPSVDRRS